ncbi:TniB family NTP-binding protein [Pseudobutyrivibrio ruminis]|uniref:TniB family NTP-binding protein n=1 Tax=Pseudobutyrivibrio ruminis TaxID=46206 RepID=UPI000427A27F|nr:TniB family NTP-binding protein [Pseudobutyrivibrio ruminis]
MTKDLFHMPAELLSGDSLINSLQDLPDYNEGIREADEATRLMQSTDIYKVYYPSVMSIEIYNKLYLATALSLKKKNSRLATIQKNVNYSSIHEQSAYRGIIGGADSFSIIGTSGIGKSSAIQKAIELISPHRYIEFENSKIIPCLQVQCPFDASPKGMLLSVLKSVDDCIGTDYYKRSQRTSITTDILIGTVGQVCINHIGLLIIDEIQHVSGQKNGVTLINLITQLINISGVSICMVGTEESVIFFEKAQQLARRTLGMRYGQIPYDDYFKKLCEILYSYQYTRKYTELTDVTIRWLYEHTGGIISVLVSIIHDANEIAILSGKEQLSIEVLSEAYDKRITMLHSYIMTDRVKHARTRRALVKTEPLSDYIETAEYKTLPEMVLLAKNQGVDAVKLISKYITIEEVEC